MSPILQKDKKTLEVNEVTWIWTDEKERESLTQYFKKEGWNDEKIEKYLIEMEEMRQELYGKDPVKQREQQEALRKGREFFEKDLPPETQEAINNMFNSMNPDVIEEFFKVFIKSGGDPKIIEEGYNNFLRNCDFSKKEGLESSESIIRISNLIKKRLP